ncbi:MAG: type II toxin-antitoxin system VapC family toxin [Rhodospirillaceae bacterium]|nr:type II toxin-antitoxin system VapC family toxin [Rhodospirillaceae bacterium]MYB11938.1 type II toxin-antitoxin system VapC family toxin [Rhodospirillaceae bacterium]MYI48864.1 type II toxin-antitoxin system VapC family toxin [Rhodospirillaceae bacterium]
MALARFAGSEPSSRKSGTLVSTKTVAGNRLPDAYHAALAIEHGCEWVTLDRGYAIFPGLRILNLLDG